MTINKLNDRVTFLDLLEKTNETATTVNNTTAIGSSFVTDMLQATGDYIDVDSFGEINTLYTASKITTSSYTASYDGILYIVLQPSSTISNTSYIVGLNVTLGIRPHSSHPYNGWNYICIPLRKNDIGKIETDLDCKVQGCRFYRVQPSQTALDLVSKSNALATSIQTTTTFQTSNVIKVGQIIDDTNVLSGFKGKTSNEILDANYCRLPIPFTPENNTWELVFKFKKYSCISQPRIFQHVTDRHGVYLMIKNNKSLLCLSSNNQTWDIAYDLVGTHTLENDVYYWFKLIFNGSSYVLSISTDGITYENDITVNSTSTITGGNYLIGINEVFLEPLDGYIDLNECYININGNRFWSGVNVCKTSILDILYPIGSIYIGTMQVCPLQVLGIGNWELVGSDKVLQGAGTRGAVDTTLDEALPNITGKFACATPTNHANFREGAFNSDIFSTRGQVQDSGSTPTNQVVYGYNIDASRSSSIYQDNAHVQPDAYLVNIWKRIA